MLHFIPDMRFWQIDEIEGGNFLPHSFPLLCQSGERDLDGLTTRENPKSLGSCLSPTKGCGPFGIEIPCLVYSVIFTGRQI